MHSLARLVCIAAFIVFMAQGLRNRSGPRWLAMTGLISVAVVFEVEWINIIAYGTVGTIVLCIWYASVAAMFLLHAARPWGENRERSKTNRLGALAYGIVISSFVLVMAAWFIILQIVLLSGSFDVENETILTRIAACHTSWPAYVLFFLAVIFAVYQSNRARS
jgi:hypothetical protein